MNTNKYLKESLVIVAESDEQVASDIVTCLKSNGFEYVETVQSGAAIYEMLKAFYNVGNQAGLIIVNEQLPETELAEMCGVLSSLDDGLLIPFIVLTENADACVKPLKESNAKAIVHALRFPINYPELLSVIKLQLVMREERLLRYEQKQRLINELSERKLLDAKLKYLVVHDELTGLLNRSHFEQQLRQLLKQKKALGEKALLFIDMDRFSIINELEGFDTGDQLLVEIVSTVRALLSKQDLFARIGSDEFVLFVKNKSLDEVRQLANNVREKIEKFQFITNEESYSVSASVGVFLLNLTDTSELHPSDIIAKAKQACNMAKENGRNLVWFYNQSDTKVQERNNDLYWVPIIKHALLENRFFLVFQPVVDLSTGIVSHYEVLLRMQDKDKKTIYPGDFIPVAERMGLIHGIDRWVVVNAINALAEQQTIAAVAFAVNLSSVAFQDESLLPLLKRELERTQLPAELITFEITETAAIENFEQTRQLIEDIRALGCKFALDDFGAGFCSFNYLKSFPVDYVKIDGQFIQNLLEDTTDQVLVKSMAEIGKNLGKKTIAEFVETPDVVLKLKELGVTLGQGYLFGKPEINLLANHSISLEELMNQQS